MTFDWSNSTSPSDDSIVILLVGRMDSLTPWSQAFQMDSRFRVTSVATDPQDAEIKLAQNPELVLVDATVFAGPKELLHYLTKIQGGVYIVIPSGAKLTDADMQALRTASCTRNIYSGPPSIPDLVNRMVADISALRRQAPAVAGRSAWSGSHNVVGGVRVLTIWNRCGGTGKTTIACALALDAAQRGYKTLLVGLSTPDISIPTFLKLKTTPNLSGWLARPTLEEGLLASVQSVGSLDVLVGLQDTIRERDLGQNPDLPESINKLATTAAYGGYAIIILDAPVSIGYLSAISASNSLLLVSTPMLDQAITTAEAYNVVFKKMSGQHRVGVGNAYIVLNRGRSGMLGADEWHEAASTFARSAGIATFPPVAASIPDVPEVPLSGNAGRSPLTASEQFARPIHRLGDLLFGVSNSKSFESRQAESGPSIFKLGPIRIRRGG